MTAASAANSGGSIITNAVPPAASNPATPKKKIVLPSGAVAGLVIGLALAFLMDRRDKRIRGAHDVERVLGLPAMLTVPAMPSGQHVPSASPGAGQPVIELAHAVNKPVVCHIRDAHDDARAILREGRAAELGCVSHCFPGTPDDAREYAAMGCYVSFSGIVTYKTAQNLRDSVPLVPRERLMIETDCPYLAPVPKRGKRNEPAFVVHTAEVVAAAAGLPFEELAQITTANAARVYRLP